MRKHFGIEEEDLLPLVNNTHYCYVSNQVAVAGRPIRFFYREMADSQEDSGWRFMSGYEDSDFLNSADNLTRYSLNAIANHEQTLVEHLSASINTAFEKIPGETEFSEVEEYAGPEYYV